MKKSFRNLEEEILNHITEKIPMVSHFRLYIFFALIKIAKHKTLYVILRKIMSNSMKKENIKNFLDAKFIFDQIILDNILKMFYPRRIRKVFFGYNVESVRNGLCY